MRPLARAWLFAALFFALLLPSRASAFTPPPLPYGSYVVDTAAKLTEADKAYFDAKLARVSQETGAKIAVFVVGSLADEPVEDVSIQTARTWGVGTKGVDKGVLLLIAPGARKLRIEVSQNLQGDLTDLQANDIIQQMKPFMKADDVRGAVDVATSAIAKAIGATATTPITRSPYGTAHRRNVTSSSPLVMIGIPIAIILLIVIIRMRGGGGGGGGYYGGGGGFIGGGGGDWGGGGGGGDSGGGGGGGGFDGGGSSDSY